MTAPIEALDDCRLCGKTFTPRNERHRFCSDLCRHRYHQGQPDMRELRARFGKRCWWCRTGRQARPNFAHTAPTNLRGRGRGLWKRYTDINRNPERYALLCRPCHLRYDRMWAAQRAQVERTWNRPDWITERLLAAQAKTEEALHGLGHAGAA